MASLGHIAVGMAAARWRHSPGQSARALGLAMVGWSVWSMLPDADVVAFALGIPYGATWGHRGASHGVVFAGAASLVAVGMLARRQTAGWKQAALMAFAVMASHGVLDAFTDGGLGVALGWPFTNTRFFWPVRPIPVAPIGLGYLSARGLQVALAEAMMFAPLWFYALWPRRRAAAT